MKYCVPSKTFLVGEYSVLVGGPALGLATLPCFEISYPEDDNEFRFHPDSPAALYLKDKNITRYTHIYDPYAVQGVKGGFGKSTTEYFAAALPEILKTKKTVVEIQKDYLSLFKSQKVKPSGVDLLIQYLGNVAFIRPQDQIYQSLKWRFSDLNFFILSTGLKIPTHEHLEKLNLSELKEVPAVSNQVIDAYLYKESQDFLIAMKEWVQTLRKLKLTHPVAVEMKEQLEKIPKISLVKPCGALGADVMLVFFCQQDLKEIENQLRQLKFKIHGDRESLTEGLMSYVD